MMIFIYKKILKQKKTYAVGMDKTSLRHYESLMMVTYAPVGFCMSFFISTLF